jgi:hypothetical protein
MLSSPSERWAEHRTDPELHLAGVAGGGEEVAPRVGGQRQRRRLPPRLQHPLQPPRKCRPYVQHVVCTRRHQSHIRRAAAHSADPLLCRLLYGLLQVKPARAQSLSERGNTQQEHQAGAPAELLAAPAAAPAAPTTYSESGVNVAARQAAHTSRIRCDSACPRLHMLNGQSAEPPALVRARTLAFCTALRGASDAGICSRAARHLCGPRRC